MLTNSFDTDFDTGSSSKIDRASNRLYSLVIYPAPTVVSFPPLVGVTLAVVAPLYDLEHRFQLQQTADPSFFPSGRQTSRH